MAREVPHLLAAALLCGAFGPAADAQNLDAAGRVFADHCFSPYLTAAKARTSVDPTGARVDFYDLRPFSSAAASPVQGREATPGTDRRCEVAFDGKHVDAAQQWVVKGLAQEGLSARRVEVPAGFALLPTTDYAAAVQLNPNRIAVTQTGTRPGPAGPETYMNVERLVPRTD